MTEQFAWRHYYWYLTNEGIQYLRDFLHLPPEIVPSTLRRQTRPEAARPRPKGTFLLLYFLMLVSTLFCHVLLPQQALDRLLNFVFVTVREPSSWFNCILLCCCNAGPLSSIMSYIRPASV